MPFGQDHSAPESQSALEARLYKSLAESSLGLMCCHDPDGILVWINSAAASSLGYTVQEAIGVRLDTFLVPAVRALFPSYLERIKRTGSDKGVMRLLAKDGSERIWMYRNILSRDPDLLQHTLGNALDITEQYRAQRAFKDLFRHTPIGQMELDAEGKLLQINPAACKMLGYSEFELLFSRDPLPVNDFFKDLAAGEQGQRLVIFARQDGSVLHLEVHVRRLPAHSSGPGGVACALLDVSERVRAETRIMNLNAQLEARVNARTAELRQSNAELREFSSIASHDLQSPLKQLEKALGQIAERTGDAKARLLIEHSEDDVRRMLMLIDSLLSYAVASNRSERKVQQVSLAVAIEESLMILASEIAGSDAVVTYDSLPDIQVDESDFVQLFQNLIGNALKYKGREKPRIAISARQGQGVWTISIKDNGIGIDPVYSERIFEAFRRLHGKEYAGSGMGLAICKKIVERAGGKIWVEPAIDGGSVFRFAIPY